MMHQESAKASADVALGANIGRELLDQSCRQIEFCHRKINHCLAQLSEEQLWWRRGEGFNSIANLVLHLEGNIQQRIVSLIGGAPDERNRDYEFAQRDTVDKATLMARWAGVIARTLETLSTLPPERLLETRRYPMLRGAVEGTFVTLIVHTIVHLGGHTQEIVALTRLQLGDQYQFLESGHTKP